MIGPFDLRDLWQEDLRDESRRTRGKCPEPYEELAYTAWKLAEEKIPVITVEPERTWVWSDLHLGDESAVAAAGHSTTPVEWTATSWPSGGGRWATTTRGSAWGMSPTPGSGGTPATCVTSGATPATGC